MWYGSRHSGSFGFPGFGPFGIFVNINTGFPRRSDYLQMLEQYRDDLREELERVEQEIADLRDQTGGEGGTASR